jgi:hypothetical protein
MSAIVFQCLWVGYADIRVHTNTATSVSSTDVEFVANSNKGPMSETDGERVVILALPFGLWVGGVQSVRLSAHSCVSSRETTDDSVIFANHCSLCFGHWERMCEAGYPCAVKLKERKMKAAR